MQRMQGMGVQVPRGAASPTGLKPPAAGCWETLGLGNTPRWSLLEDEEGWRLGSRFRVEAGCRRDGRRLHTPDEG